MAKYQHRQINLLNIPNETLFLSFTVVQFVFQNNEKRPSYDALNGHRYSKNNKKVECLIIYFWEAIQTMRVKFLWDTYDHQGYWHTKFHPILRGSYAKPW